MDARSAILRAGICTALICRHPNAWTAGQLRRCMAPAMRPAEFAELLDLMVRDGLLVAEERERPRPRGPLIVYLAAEHLRPARRKPANSPGEEPNAD